MEPDSGSIRSPRLENALRAPIVLCGQVSLVTWRSLSNKCQAVAQRYYDGLEVGIGGHKIIETFHSPGLGIVSPTIKLSSVALSFALISRLYS